MPAGVTRWKWDGRDTIGRPVPAGVYLERLTAGDSSVTRRLVLFP